ncbi:MAG: SdiA-regulated domain-containing protein [Bacteroidota bacterium]
MKYTYIFFWMILWSLLSCSSTEENTTQSDTSATPQPAQSQPVQKVSVDSLAVEYNLPFDLTAPDKVVSLPSALEEASGATFVRDSSLGEEVLALVQDELGIVYFLDTGSEQIVKEVPFYKAGDYEGVAALPNARVFVLKSKGTLYEVSSLAGKEGLMNKYPTFLSEDDDTEGLVWDEKRNRLLIFCKEPYIQNGREMRNFRVAYGFDMIRRELDAQPALIMDLQLLKSKLAGFRLTEGLAFDPSSKKDFKPSGVAIDPLTGNYYVISSTGKLLVVMDEFQQFITAAPLPRARFPQPEGICFSPEGDLYIVNEARDDIARVLKFQRK